jgi:hypothetical protein
MGNSLSVVSNKNKEYISKNWGDLKCSPIGPFLQSSGLAPGDPKETANQCQSNSFSSQFNSSMTDQFKATDQLNKGLGAMGGTINNIRNMLAMIQQQIFKNLSKVADMIFGIYIKIGNIVMVINRLMVKIMMVFKNLINVGMALAIMLISLLNLIRRPINAAIKLTSSFCFSQNTLVKLKNGKTIRMKELNLGDILNNGSIVNGIMKISNVNDEYFYKLKKNDGKYIYVTGSHYIFSHSLNKYIMVKDHPQAKLSNKKDNEFSCIITNDHNIVIDKYTFWDWEDELLLNK